MFSQHLTTSPFTRANARPQVSRGVENQWLPAHRGYLIKAYRLVDLVSVMFSLLAVFVAIHLKTLPNGLASFLTMRVTIKNLLLMAGVGLIWQGIFKLCRLYDPALINNYRDEAQRVLAGCSFGSLCTLALSLASGNATFSPPAFVCFWGGVIITTLVSRHIVHVLTPEWTPFTRQNRRLLIIGSGPRALRLYRSVLMQSQSEHRMIGFVDTRPTQEMDEAISTRLIGRLDQLEEILTSRVVDEVLIALPIKSCYSQIQQTIAVCERIGVECKYLSDIFQVSHPRTQVEANSHYPLITIKMVSDDYRLLVKRALDILGASTALILFSPLMLIVMAAVKLTSHGPAIFVQERYGLNKRRFRMFKFRTMVQNAEALQHQLEDKNEAQGPVFKIKDDPRVTRIGKVLRKTSIDELPQLFNVLRGDMSLVGPRPLPERDVSRFAESSLMRRFSVKPGLTCLWQISGRSNTEFDHWIKQDLQYIDQWSLGLDVTILFKTVPAVIKGRGAV